VARTHTVQDLWLEVEYNKTTQSHAAALSAPDASKLMQRTSIEVGINLVIRVTPPPPLQTDLATKALVQRRNDG